MYVSITFAAFRLGILKPRPQSIAFYNVLFTADTTMRMGLVVEESISILIKVFG